MDYQLDAKSAIAADVMHSKIDCSGKYIGIITRAEPVTSKKGAQGVDLSFKADTGATADYLTIWTHGKDDKQLQGFNTLMAIMTCLRVKGLKAEAGEIEKYNPDTKAREKVSIPLFKELMNKPVGLLLQMEEYPKTAGGTGWKPLIAGAFDKDEFTASEILSKATKQEKLMLMVQALKDKPMKQGAALPPSQQSENPGHGMSDSFSDDIPFNREGACGLWRSM